MSAASLTPGSSIALVQTNETCNSSMSGDFSGAGFDNSLGFEMVWGGRWSLVTPGGNGHRVILIGIWVSTLDLRGVGMIFNWHRPLKLNCVGIGICCGIGIGWFI